MRPVAGTIACPEGQRTTTPYTVRRSGSYRQQILRRRFACKLIGLLTQLTVPSTPLKNRRRIHWSRSFSHKYDTYSSIRYTRSSSIDLPVRCHDARSNSKRSAACLKPIAGTTSPACRSRARAVASIWINLNNAPRAYRTILNQL